jgi:integrase
MRKNPMQVTDKGMNANFSGQDQWLVESLGRGAGAFVGRISPSGARSFYFRYTGPGGTQVRLPIGRYDGTEKAGTTVAKARKRAVEWSELYKGAGEESPGIRDLRGHFAQLATDQLSAQQADRELEDRQRREAAETDKRNALEMQRRLTVRQLFDRWAATELAPRIQTDGRRAGRKDGGQYCREQFERHVFPTVGEFAAKEVRKSDLMALLDAQKIAGKMRTANVLLTELKQMFRFAQTRDIVERNPLDTVEKRHVGGKETERSRVLSLDEIAALARQLPAANMGLRSEVAPCLLLATACRISELMNARWEHIDLVENRWRIPPEHSKNQREHIIHLSRFVTHYFQILSNLSERDKTGRQLPWVFPNRFGNGPVCIKSFGKQLSDRQRPAEKRMKNRASKTESLLLAGGRWTAHDLRRTAATLMAGLEVSSDVIDECLNHMIQGRVTRIYIRDRRQAEQARAFDALGEKLDRLFHLNSEVDNVIQIRSFA